jgi:multicomponent Na+:H+ antiporter subunit F
MRKVEGHTMNNFLLCLGMGLFTLVFLCLYRGIFNRIAAISAIGTKTLIILLIMGFIYNRVDMFVDISMVYALLNFIGTITAAKYLEIGGEI